MARLHEDRNEPPSHIPQQDIPMGNSNPAQVMSAITDTKPTPETEEVFQNLRGKRRTGGEYTLKRHAEKLERERNALQKKLEDYP